MQVRDGPFGVVGELLEDVVVVLDGGGVLSGAVVDLAEIVEGVAGKGVIGRGADDLAELGGGQRVVGGHVVAEGCFEEDGRVWRDQFRRKRGGGVRGVVRRITGKQPALLAGGGRRRDRRRGGGGVRRRCRAVRIGCGGGVGGEVLQGGVDGLLLVLHGFHSFFQVVKAGLDLVERVVEGLHLAGELVELGVGGVVLRAHLLLEGVDGDRHLVDRIGALLDEVLEDAHALVVGLLEAGDGGLQFLDLGLELNHILVDGEGGRRGEGKGEESEGELRTELDHKAIPSGADSWPNERMNKFRGWNGWGGCGRAESIGVLRLRDSQTTRIAPLRMTSYDC